MNNLRRWYHRQRLLQFCHRLWQIVQFAEPVAEQNQLRQPQRNQRPQIQPIPQQNGPYRRPQRMRKPIERLTYTHK